MQAVGELHWMQLGIRTEQAIQSDAFKVDVLLKQLVQVLLAVQVLQLGMNEEQLTHLLALIIY